MPVFNNMLAGASGGAGAGYEIERSLRFNSADSAYLNRTPSAASNRKTWTWAGWVKRGAINGVDQTLFSAGNATLNVDLIRFDSSDKLDVLSAIGGISWRYTSSAVYRDPSAWLHCVVAVDTTDSTAADRVKIYVNGIRLTDFASSSAPSLNFDNLINSSVAHAISYDDGNNGYFFNGYLADVHFIDGQALAPTDFGETDNNGVWQPKKFAGTYTTHTVPVYNSTYGSDITSTEVAKTIDGDIATYGVPTGDFVGYTYSNTNDPIINIKWENTKGSAITVYIQPWVSGGAANAGTFASSGANSVTIVAGATLETTFTFPAGYDGYFRIYASGDGTNLRIYDVGGVARTFNSFHLPFSDNSSNAALGTDTSGNSNTWTVNNLAAQASTDAVAGTHSGKDGISFNGTNAEINLTSDSDVNPGSGVFTLECYAYALSGGSAEFGIYDGSPGGSGSFVLRRVGAGTLMVERHNTAFDITGGSFSEGVWHHVAVTRDSSNNVRLFVDGTQSGSTSTSNTHNYQGTFRLGRTNNAFTNGYISNLRLIKGTCLYTSNFTAPTGNLSNVTNTKLLMAQSTTSATAATVKPSGLTISGSGDSTIIDSLLDTPTNGTQVDTGAGGEVVGNYATLNPIDKGSNVVLSNGNLEYTKSTTTWSDSGVRGTFGISSGKWYWEVTKNSTTSYSMYGVAASAASFSESYGSPTESWTYISDSGNKFGDGAGGSGSSYGATFTNGDVIGVALDMDAGTLVFYKNGTSQGTAFSSLSGKTVFPWLHLNTSGDSAILNTGSRAFAHTAPSGYKSLNTANLTATIEDGSKYFDTKLWTGNGTSQTITGLGFSPDLVWAKGRNTTSAQVLVDNVRGAQKSIFSDQTTAELDRTSVTAFNSDGFTLGDYVNTNGNTNSYVGWAWDAGDDANPTTIAAGSLNSSLYDQSQTWSNGTQSNADTGRPLTNLFDNSTSTLIAAASGSNSSNKITLPVSITAQTSVRYYSMAGGYNNGPTTLSNSGTTVSTIAAESSQSTGWKSFSGSFPMTFNEFTVQRSADAGGTGSGAALLEVDGKILVDSGVSVANVPSIASTVRANPTAGFSIVKLAMGSGSNTVGHGLGAAPSLLITKSTSNTSSWWTYHESLGTGSYLALDSNAAAATNYSWGAAPTSTVLTANNNFFTNGYDYIVYCFAPVEGYSAIGSYTGNGSADGPFVYTGMSPKWLLYKRTDAADTVGWILTDAARNTFNVIDDYLAPNVSSAEGTTPIVDFLSNGFKLRISGNDGNVSNGNYLYVAFAENPFKIARAR